MSFVELERAYKKKLASYPFESEEEAINLNLSNITITEKETLFPLETPFSMKSRQIKKESKIDELANTAHFSDSSSDIEEDTSTEYEGDVHLRVSLFVRGKQIIDDSELVLIRGTKYGLVGRNGVGKTSLLKFLRKKNGGVPANLKVHLIKQESTTTQSVIDYVGAEASKILSGLGFSKKMAEKPINSLSGGWRMRAQLAKAIHINPDLLLLDEPTNYLDINALTWLESQIQNLKTVIIVSHDRNFLNNTVTEILHLSDLKIDTYKGNYDCFVKQRVSRKVAYKLQYDKQMAYVAQLQSFIDRFRYNAKRASLAQSKIKALAKLPKLEPPKIDPIITFKFESSPCSGCLIDFQNVSFRYDKGNMQDCIFDGLDIKINSDSRIVIVGANGKGKSTFLKLLTKKIEPTEGSILRNSGLKVGYFAQHHVDHLQVNERVLDFVMKDRRQEEARRALSSFGLSVDNQLIETLSGGQKSRLAFSIINMQEPNLLVLDEPTNHLDMESIEALADSLNKFKGAIVCVSHDLSFVTSVFKEVYVCENKTLKWFRGTIVEYKNSLLHTQRT